VDRLLTFAHAEAFDVISVAAVPAQGAAFWSKNGFSYYPDPNNTSSAKYPKQVNDAKDLAPDAAKAKQICTFLHANMFVFPDTPLFARVL